ncbi:hypothetical protein OKW21_000978 [Catalinimonas alkaloidigena]|uniref:hypothetical protein n=1 Tax=Catalinimonas alkaloidigena TaxID=1075417 RepID=UPI002404D01D|nr:hypothetical protein [Catalinimonas alkaloidigena]MDF9795715.1 hypothetical protein [Catalinimonas alkaloidigena]
MKKLSILLFAGILLSTMSMAQSRNDLKGPKAKNYKHWKHEDSKSAILFTSEVAPKGPAAKNQKPWRNTPEVIENAQLVDVSTTRAKVTGPKAKNTRPWEIKRQEIKTIASREDSINH